LTFGLDSLEWTSSHTFSATDTFGEVNHRMPFFVFCNGINWASILTWDNGFNNSTVGASTQARTTLFTTFYINNRPFPIIANRVESTGGEAWFFCTILA
jgi:hypothetical protein